MPCSNENECRTDPRNYGDEFHGNRNEWEKPDTKENIPNDAICEAEFLGLGIISDFWDQRTLC